MKLTDLRVLALVPGTKWKKDDVGREYQSTAERHGVPRDIVCDGASELGDPAQTLESEGEIPNVIRDLKHHAANLLEKIVGKSKRYLDFQKQVGLTRNHVQQTELSHFAPPLKQKSRFMNRGCLWRWGIMVCWHLGHPASKARQGITAKRMKQKLGWGSTEVLESRYGQYKCLEGQHSKGGFTRLLAAMPALTVHWTAERVRDAFERVSVKDMKEWVKTNLGQTLNSRRREAYQECSTGFA